MMPRSTILVVDDEKSILAAISSVLKDEGYEVRTASNGETALASLNDELPDLVLLDIWMPGIDGLETLTRMRSLVPDIAIIMISGHGTIETAVRALQLGAINFIEKPLSLPKLVLEVQNALEQKNLERENKRLKMILHRHFKLVGESRTMAELRRMIQIAGPSNGRVLITGESGTGKELIAREIHQVSQRVNGPFVEVNCAAIPDDLIESELFGHEKGSFTSATYQKKGKFELASGGTLFLDEIGDMSLKTQAKVLRAIEDSRIERVGGSRTIAVDVRIIAASNKNISSLIEQGNFREDLYYRLNVIPIMIKPLREHADDIESITAHFLELFCSEYGKSTKKLAPDALQLFCEYRWPGNVRELRNEIERLVIMTASDVIRAKDLRPDFHKRSVIPRPDNGVETLEDLKTARESWEKQVILRRLEECRWNVTQTAESLGIERSHLHRKLKALGITSSEEVQGDEK